MSENWLGVLLRERREHRGLSASQLSLGLGLSKSYVSKLEKGEHVPNVMVFSKLALALEFSPYEIAVIIFTLGKS